MPLSDQKFVFYYIFKNILLGVKNSGTGISRLGKSTYASLHTKCTFTSSTPEM